ncbi:hypothetical protein ASD01_29570 [Ensifer sp. Root423]|nr:hypothetical protein ASD01_29570 [Ensifer sp. Root423]
MGTDQIEVFDDGEPAVFVDLISECSIHNGIARIGLVQVANDLGGVAEAKVCARFRMNLATAADLRNFLTNLLDGNAEAKEKAN